MNKKLVCIFIVLITIFSCNSIKRTVAFRKEYGFQKSDGCFISISDIKRIEEVFDCDNKEIHIKNSRLFENNNIIHWQGQTIDKDGHLLPFVYFYEYDSTGIHYLKKSDKYGTFSIKTQNPYCKGFYLDCDYVEIWTHFS